MSLGFWGFFRGYVFWVWWFKCLEVFSAFLGLRVFLVFKGLSGLRLRI